MFEIALYISIIQSIFFAVLISVKKEKTVFDKYLLTWLIILSLHITGIALSSLNSSYDLFLWQTSICFTLLHGPFLYLYTKALTQAHKKGINKDFWHFVPFFIMLGVSILCFSFEEKCKSGLLATRVSGIVSGVIYIIAAAVLLQKRKKNIKTQFSYTEKINLSWLTNLILGLVIMWIGAIICIIAQKIFMINIPMKTIFSILIFVFVFIIGFKGIKQGIIFKYSPLLEYKINNMQTNSSYTKYGLKKQDSIKIAERLNKYMKEEQPFLDTELSLSKLAKEINTYPHYLTQVLNENMKLNFYDYVNSFRIKEVKKELNNPKNSQFTILAIAYDCGFNSKSVFNRIFKQKTGLTPSEYKKITS